MRGSGSEKNKGAVPGPCHCNAFHYSEGSLTLVLQVQPGAARTEWSGFYGTEALRLRLAAPAVDGRANRACITFLAKALGVPKSQVVILRGESSRRKVVRISDLTPERVDSLRKAWQS